MEDFQIIDNCLMVRMPEEVDHHRASYICEGADRLLVRENVENVVFDFEDTRFMDSSGIGIIMGRYRKISCFGGHVYAIHADRRSSGSSVCPGFTRSSRSCRVKRWKEDPVENERNYSKNYEKQCNNRRRNEENMVAERENIQVTEEKELLQQRTQGSRNEMEIVFDAVSCNESFARVAVAAFITHLNPTLEELADIKTAVSEAVTNAIIHGYENLSGYTKHGEMRPAYSIIHPGKVRLHCILENDTLSIEVSDQGKGIEDVARAMEPLFTTKPELERSGMGFAFMEAFMDELEVESIPGKGTRVHMWKKMRCGDWIGKED